MKYNTNLFDTINPMCSGCIYNTSSTAINLNGPSPCANCSRNYRDHYKSLTVPMPNTKGAKYKNIH